MRNIVQTVNVILLLPGLIKAQIEITIAAGTDVKTSEVFVSGCDRAKATKMDLNTFSLTENRVRQNLGKLGWHSVDDLLINKPKSYGYQPIHVSLEPKQAKVLRARERIIKLSSKRYRNEFTIIKKFKPELKQYVTITVDIKWYSVKNISVGRIINHTIGRRTIEYAAVYGFDESASKIIPIRAKSRDEVAIKTGENVKADLLIKETIIEVRIDYEVSLDGDFYFGIHCTYLFKICPKHISLNVNEYFRLLNQSPVIRSHEVVMFRYYHEPHVKVEEPYSAL